MRVLHGVVRPYAWGSRTAIATMRGMPTPSPHPEAELWFGAHPASPATLPDSGEDLAALIASDPVGTLGSECVERFGDRLPFLVKVLAAEEPLSLQAHPSSRQAAEGFAKENALGLALDAANRNYRDPWHKPELIVALTEFDALAGFQDPEITVELLASLQVPELDPYLGMLAGQPDSVGLRALFTTWLTLPESVLATLVPAMLGAAVRELERGDTRFAPELRSLLELGEAYPDDPGVPASLLLNHIRLQPGEAIFLAAGHLHAYLRGTGVEVMANSDNVLRGGLTPKYIDVPELLRVLDFTPVPREQLNPPLRSLNAERIYLTPAPEFRMSRVELDGTGLHHASSISFDMPGPEILVVVAGAIEVRDPTGRSITARAGEAVWLADADPDVVVSAAASRADFFRVLVPLNEPDSRS